MNPAIAMRAWEEILTESLGKFEMEKDARPEWMVNPATGRRLKLDRYYPSLGLAIRFVGLTAKGHRIGVWEEKEIEERESIRKELCNRNGVRLVLIAPTGDHQDREISKLCQALNQITRKLSTRKNPPRKILSALAESKSICRSIATKAKEEEFIFALAERHRDREINKVAALSRKDAGKKASRTGKIRLRPGTRVRHETFGRGIVDSLEPDGEDTKITIRFGENSRTFLLSLVSPKLSIVRK